MELKKHTEFRNNCLFIDTLTNVQCSCQKYVPEEINSNGINNILCAICKHANNWHTSKKEYIIGITKYKSKCKKYIKILENDIVCCICMENESDIVIFPCGHHNFCKICISGLEKCPLCREKIKEILDT